jgi:hypothetical protein
MDEQFRTYLKRSAIGHGIALLLIIGAPALVNWRIHRRNVESITFVDFTVALPGDTSVAPVKEFEEPKASEKAPPKNSMTEPSPDKTEKAPSKDAITEPSLEKTGHKIQKSTKKIKRPQGGTVQKSNLSAEEIRRLLAAGARISDHTSIPMGDLWEAGYYNHVHEMMYRVWNQPTSLSASAGLSAEVLIRVQRDGTITPPRNGALLRQFADGRFGHESRSIGFETQAPPAAVRRFVQGHPHPVRAEQRRGVAGMVDGEWCMGNG